MIGVLFAVFLIELFYTSVPESDRLEHAAAGDGQTLYFPFIRDAPLIALHLNEFWLEDAAGTEQVAFVKIDPLAYAITGRTTYATPITVTVQ